MGLKEYRLEQILVTLVEMSFFIIIEYEKLSLFYVSYKILGHSIDAYRRNTITIVSGDGMHANYSNMARI